MTTQATYQQGYHDGQKDLYKRLVLQLEDSREAIDHNTEVTGLVTYQTVMDGITFNPNAELAFLDHFQKDNDINNLLMTAALALKTAASLGRQRRLDLQADCPEKEPRKDHADD